MATELHQAYTRGRWRGWAAPAAGLVIVAIVGFNTFYAVGQDARGGEVELIVRGPDGRPLAGSRVIIVPAARASDGGQTHELAVQSDGEGRVHFRWTSGVVRQMDVRVEGVGYGFAGASEVLADRTVKAPLAPLAPFGAVMGTLPAGLAGARTVVRLQSVNNTYEQEVTVPFVADGRFRAAVRAGRWRITASDGAKRLAELDGSIAIAPGQDIKGLVLHAPLPEPARKLEADGAAIDNQATAWAKGTVRDEAGRGLPGAAVYAVAVYAGGTRMYETVAKTTTDATGRYEIRGDANIKAFSASVVASLPGRPPAWGWSQSPGAGAAGKPAPDIDLAIPAKGAALEVTVRRDGQAVTGVSVIAWLEGVDLRDQWAAGTGAPERREVEAIVHPIRPVDRNGVARFEGLLPGQYRIVAATGDVDRVRDIQDSSLWETPDPYGMAEGVAVRVGSATTYRMNIYPQAIRVPMKVLRGDGRSLTTGNVFDYSSPAVGEWGRSVETKANGVIEGTFESLGLRHVSFKYRDSAIGTMRPGDEPYYEATGMVGASHLLEIKARAPARFTAMPYDPGSVVVELRNAAGRPTRGVIELDDESGRCVFAGSTDSAGLVRFDGVPAAKYVVRNYIAGEVPPDLGGGESPLPPPEQWTGRSAALSQRIEVTANSERQALVRSEPVGYVYGVVKPAAGHTAAYYYVGLSSADGSRETPVHYRASTGEFVAGPVAPGKVTVILWLEVGNGQSAKQEATVEAGKAARVELTAQESGGLAPAKSTPGARLEGRVLLHDGKTPALAARIMLLGPPDAAPILSGMIDARGAIHSRKMSRAQNPGRGDLAEPVAVAWAPGYCGAVIRPIGTGNEPLELVLPAPVSLRGKVTIAGLAPPGRNEGIRVMAGYLGKGSLNSYLSVQTIAQPDGTFELAGLAPGKYEVQAALDDIWLSESLTVTVADAPLEPVTLTVGTPGGPLVVRVVGNGGKPMRNRAVTIDRPRGPLSALLWPTEWLTDGGGEVWIPALEAGQHTVRVPRTTRTGEATVLRLPVDDAVALQIQIDERANP